MPAPVRRRLRLRPAHRPYDGGRLLWFLGLHAVPGLETWDGTTYARALRLPDGPGVVRLRATPGGYDGELALTSAADERVARAALTHLLDLGSDPAAALDHLGSDGLLGPLVARRPGLRAPGSVDHVETLVRTDRRPAGLARRGAHGDRAGGARRTGTPLPDGARLGWVRTPASPGRPCWRRVDPASPADAPRPGPRPSWRWPGPSSSTAETVADGRQERVLLGLPGIGPWTAAYQALRAARDPDVFLPTDLAVRRALEGHGRWAGPAAALAGSTRLGAAPQPGPHAPVDRAAGGAAPDRCRCCGADWPAWPTSPGPCSPARSTTSCSPPLTVRCAAMWFSPHQGRSQTGFVERMAAQGGRRDDQHPVLVEAARQLGAYFAGDRQEFDLPLAPVGTPFQLQVWAALRTIPYGQTWSYGELAGVIGKSPASSRAVGLANGSNPISIVVPCHRVIGADGGLTGFGGGVERKRYLLDLERPSLFSGVFSGGAVR